MAETHETIADIIAEMRRRSDEAYKGSFNYPECQENQIEYDEASEWADRLEAVHKRERGDCAKLREALEELMKFTCNSCQERYCEEDVEEEDGQRIPSPCSVIIKARAALAAPPRNCDRFKTAAEAIDAYQDLTGDQLATDSGMKEWVEFAVWLFDYAKESEVGK